jgi:hypothetical protein
MITNVNESLENYAFHRASAIINHNENNKSIVRDREIGRVFAEYKDKLVIIDGKNKKEHEYLIPKTKYIAMAISEFILIYQKNL